MSAQAKNGLTAMHLCAQEDRVDVAKILVTQNAAIDCPTKAGYTPLHVACHFGNHLPLQLSNAVILRLILEIEENAMFQGK